MAAFGECEDVKSGKEALELFNKNLKKKTPFDLIILDISMPDMDGIQVLHLIRKKENALDIPKAGQVKIIMATASMRKSSIKKCIRLGCSSYISKPVKTGKLIKELDRLGFNVSKEKPADNSEPDSYTDLVADVVNRFNKGEIKLPVLPHVVKKIQELSGKSEPSIDELSSIVEKDTVISARLIMAANSPVYKGVDTVSTLNEALLRLGIKEALSVITALASKNLYQTGKEEVKSLLQKLWLHSLACASCSNLIARELSDKTLGSVFLMGIIHDIGKVLLLKAVADISPEADITDKDLLAAIQEVHTVFGAVLIKKWGFSKKYIQAAELHHWESYPEKTDPELLIIHIANIIAARAGFASFNDLLTDNADADDGNPSKEEYSPEFTAVVNQLGIDPEKIKAIEDIVSKTMAGVIDNF